MIFRRKPASEDRWYLEVYRDSGKFLATSDFFSLSGHRLAAVGCIMQGNPTVKVKGDNKGSWYFQIFAGQASSSGRGVLSGRAAHGQRPVLVGGRTAPNRLDAAKPPRRDHLLSDRA